MLWVPLLAGAAGVLYARRSQPKTPFSKKTVLGVKTGVTYEVEDFRDAGFIRVQAPDGSQGIFEYAALQTPGSPGFIWRSGKGQPATLHGMFLDLGARTLAKAETKKP